MDKQQLQKQINDEINNLVPGMIEDAITSHTHTGGDSPQIQGQYLSQAPQPAVTAPSGGGTVDGSARASINEIISRLKQLGLTK